jgi:hypothetical protein
VKRKSVDSSVIRSVGYDPSVAVMEIEFTSGDLYRFFAVPPSAFDALRAADSAGRFFAERIRPVYPSEKLR